MLDSFHFCGVILEGTVTEVILVTVMENYRIYCLWVEWRHIVL